MSLAEKIVEGCEGSCAIFVVPLRSAFLGVASAGRKSRMVPRGLEPRTLRLLAVRSNLSYETPDLPGLQTQQVFPQEELWPTVYGPGT